MQVSNPIPQRSQILIVDRQSANVFVKIHRMPEALFAPDSSDIQITFREDITQPSGRSAKRSVSALVSRSMERFARARAAEAELAKATFMLEAPLLRLIGGDNEATGALDGLAQPTSYRHRCDGRVAPESIAPRRRSSDGFRTIVTNRLPFHFSWIWHDQNVHAPHNQMLILNTGEVGLVARSGSVEGGASGFVAAHAGFGLSLRTDRTVTASGWSVLEPGHFSYTMRVFGVGSNATSEGGVEVTAPEDERLIGSAGFRWWRRGISAGSPPPVKRDPVPWDFLATRPRNSDSPCSQAANRPSMPAYACSVIAHPASGAAALQSLAQGTVSNIWINC